MLKKEIRKLYREKRMNLSVGEKLRLNDLILIQLQRLVLPAYVQTLLTYWPLEQSNEVNTDLFTSYFEHLIPELITAYPVTDPVNYTMKAVVPSSESDFEENELSIPEPISGDELLPEDIDIVFVPLLAVDEKGFRVGYGKGYYDRFLPLCREDIITIGFSYFDPISEIKDTDHYDVPLNYCITPRDIYEF